MTRYRLPHSPQIFRMVDADPAWPGLAVGWVWLREVEDDGLVVAAPKRLLIKVGEAHDLRTISGGLTLTHGVISDWFERGIAVEVPVLEFWSRRPVKLRRSDVADVIRALQAMIAEMPPEPELPSVNILA